MFDAQFCAHLLHCLLDASFVFLHLFDLSGKPLEMHNPFFLLELFDQKKKKKKEASTEQNYILRANCPQKMSILHWANTHLGMERFWFKVLSSIPIGKWGRRGDIFHGALRPGNYMTSPSSRQKGESRALQEMWSPQIARPVTENGNIRNSNENSHVEPEHHLGLGSWPNTPSFFICQQVITLPRKLQWTGAPSLCFGQSFPRERKKMNYSPTCSTTTQAIFCVFQVADRMMDKQLWTTLCGTWETDRYFASPVHPGCISPSVHVQEGGTSLNQRAAEKPSHVFANCRCPTGHLRGRAGEVNYTHHHYVFTAASTDAWCPGPS